MSRRWTDEDPALLVRGRTVLGVLASTLMLYACTSPPDAGPRPSARVDAVGHVLLLETTRGGAIEVTGQATFEDLEEPIASELLADPFTTQLGTCTVSTAGEPADGTIAPVLRGAALSVGGDVTLRHAGADYASFVLEDGRHRLRGASGPLPTEGLTLGLPGGSLFGGFASVPVATGAPLEFEGGFDAAAVRPDTEFVWKAGDEAAAVLLIGSQGSVTFSCLTEDDGSFRFPDAAVADLTAAGFTSGALVAAGRLTVQAHEGTGVYLLIGALRLVSGPALEGDRL